MKKTSLLLTGLCFALIAYSQVPGVRNTKYFNTTDDGEAIYDIKATPDNGYIVVGADSVGSYNKSLFLNKFYRGLGFIAKLDSGGNVMWRRTNASNGYESAFVSVILTDGGYVTTGYSGDPMPPYDTSDVIIRKYSNSGSLLWEKRYGGTKRDGGYSIAKTSTGGYIIAGYTLSNDGDVTGNHAVDYADVWLIKTDADGNAIWKKCYGGSSSDTAYSVIETMDKGYAVVGSSRSADGDLNANGGMADGWIFKTDNSGNLLWQRKLGGSGMDGFTSVVENKDGGLAVTGYVGSGDTEVNSGFGFHGKTDLLMAKYDRFGLYLWGWNFGGPENERGMLITRTQDDNWLVAGYTESNSMEVSGNNGLSDAWLLKIAGDGGYMMWQKCIGTNKDEFGMGVVCLTENDFVVAGVAQPPVPAGPFDISDGYIAKLGNANTIKGILYLDANSNGSKDPGENFFSNAIVKSTKSGGYERSSIPVNGLFDIDVETGSFTTVASIQSPYFNVVPSSHVSNFPTFFNTDSFSFAIQPIPGIQDLTINAIALNVARPGFDVSYKLDYRNKGTAAVANGTILFKKDSRLSLFNAIPAISSLNGDTLKWNYSNLQPLDSGSIILRFQISPPPTVNLGDTLRSLAIITPVTGDATPSDDTAILRQRVQGSYDPNDKAENLGGNITLQEVSSADYITYVIRFQNTGTDTAFNVIVRDTLDSKLDWNTLEMVGASHPYSMQINSSNQLEWTFSGINLPDSNINEPASHGYVAYRIKPKTNLVLNDIIYNYAAIYFDFNLPVVTLAAQTQVIDITLPLHLLEFNARFQKPDALLEWSTADESNVDKFIIERGTDPIHFSQVGTVAAKNGSGLTRYQFKDGLANTSGEKFYYRLKMVDIDTKFKYSNVELVQRDGKAINELVMNPNPVRGRSGFAWINFEGAGTVELGVFDMQGRYRQIGKQAISKGFNVVPVDLSALSNGTYVLQAKVEGKVLTSRFILTR